jgi:hypothetical protein
MYSQALLRLRQNHLLIFLKFLCANPCISRLRLLPGVVRHVVRSVAQRMAPCHLGGRMPIEGSVREGKGADAAIALYGFVRAVLNMCFLFAYPASIPGQRSTHPSKQEDDHVPLPFSPGA